MHPNQTPPNPSPSQKSTLAAGKPKNFAVLFYETFPEAKSHEADIAKACAEVAQLNLVIRAEGDMDDPQLLGIHPKVKIFAGAAWWLIHERRVAENWYDKVL